VVGLCVAYSLRRAGHRVAVFDPNPPGSQCSSGNAGALSSRSVVPLAMPGVLKNAFSMLLDANGPLHVPMRYWWQAAPWMVQFVRAAEPAEVKHIAGALDRLLAGAVQSHEELARELGCADLVRRTGQLHLYPSSRALDKDAYSWSMKHAAGLRIERVAESDIALLEPEVGPSYRTGVFLPDEGWMADPLRHARAIAGALAAMDVGVTQAAITSMRRQDGGWVVSDGSRQWRASRVVVCAGIWSRPLLAAQGHDVPLESQRGYHLNIEQPGVALRRTVVLADRKVFMTPMATGLRIAGTVEFGGVARAPNWRRARLLGEHARAGVPALTLAEPTMWMGHRPCLPDSLPVLGPVPGRDGLWCAFGHGHLGLTGSVNTGRLIARAIGGQADRAELAAFAVDRFR
jgi:glycine/D-amino acid oxidase-like deaminating enzyme